MPSGSQAANAATHSPHANLLHTSSRAQQTAMLDRRILALSSGTMYVMHTHSNQQQQHSRRPVSAAGWQPFA
jgi:hypothetical protein